MGSWPRTGSHILPVETVQETEERGLDAAKFSAGRISGKSVPEYRQGREFYPIKMETLP